MVEMLPIVVDMLRRPESHKVLATVSPEGDPHVIVCGTLLVPDAGTIVMGEIGMYTTGRNLSANPICEILVWSGKDAYAVKAMASCRFEAGPMLDRLNQILDKMNVQAVAAWEFKVLSVFDEGMSKSAGTQIQ